MRLEASARGEAAHDQPSLACRRPGVRLRGHHDQELVELDPALHDASLQLPQTLYRREPRRHRPGDIRRVRPQRGRVRKVADGDAHVVRVRAARRHRDPEGRCSRSQLGGSLRGLDPGGGQEVDAVEVARRLGRSLAGAGLASGIVGRNGRTQGEEGRGGQRKEKSHGHACGPNVEASGRWVYGRSCWNGETTWEMGR